MSRVLAESLPVSLYSRSMRPQSLINVVVPNCTMTMKAFILIWKHINITNSYSPKGMSQITSSNSKKISVNVT